MDHSFIYPWEKMDVCSGSIQCFHVLVIICLILAQILVVLTWITNQSNFGDNQSLIDFPSSENLASVFNSNSFKRSISDNLLRSWLLVTFWRFLKWLGITVREDSLDTPSFELLPLDETDDWVDILDNSTSQDFSSFSNKMLTEPFSTELNDTLYHSQKDRFRFTFKKHG